MNKYLIYRKTKRVILSVNTFPRALTALEYFKLAQRFLDWPMVYELGRLLYKIAEALPNHAHRPFPIPASSFDRMNTK